MKNFRTYDLAVEFYKISSTLKFNSALKEQLSRAASSVALNLAEGSGRRTYKDQGRFFQIALGSIKECQAILDLADFDYFQAKQSADKLAAHIYRLIKFHRG